MATYLHFAPAVALAVAIGPQRIGWRLALVGAGCGVLPDADFLLYLLHIDAYSGTYGHRGFTHSMGFALLMGALGALLAGRGGPRSRWLTGTFLALCTFSHPVLDGLIDRGICNAWFWPLDGARHCLPWRPVPMQCVPLFGLDRWQQELLWIGLPLLLLANAGQLLRWWGRSWRQRRTEPVPGACSRSLAVDARGAALPEPGASAGAPLGPRAERRQRVQTLRAMVGRLRAQHRVLREVRPTTAPDLGVSGARR
jgi:inner membrane protein